MATAPRTSPHSRSFQRPTPRRRRATKFRSDASHGLRYRSRRERQIGAPSAITFFASLNIVGCEPIFGFEDDAHVLPSCRERVYGALQYRRRVTGLRRRTPRDVRVLDLHARARTASDDLAW